MPLFIPKAAKPTAQVLSLPFHRSQVSCPLKLATMDEAEGYLRGEFPSELPSHHHTSLLGVFSSATSKGLLGLVGSALSSFSPGGTGLLPAAGSSQHNTWHCLFLQSEGSRWLQSWDFRSIPGSENIQLGLLHPLWNRNSPSLLFLLCLLPLTLRSLALSSL